VGNLYLCGSSIGISRGSNILRNCRGEERDGLEGYSLLTKAEPCEQRQEKCLFLRRSQGKPLFNPYPKLDSG
jgi:hypothetical protein